MAADQVDGVIYFEAYQCLGEVVHRFVGLADGHEYLAIAVAEGLARGFVLELAFDRRAVVDERVLPEEVATFFGGFLKERRVLGDTNRHLAVDDGAITLLGRPPGERVAFEYKSSENLAVVGD